MFDAVPYDAGGPDVADFWAYGGGNSTGTYILTALGLTLMLLALISWVRQETRRMNEHEARLMKEGMLARMHEPTPTSE
jgi:hypothetical protein